MNVREMLEEIPRRYSEAWLKVPAPEDMSPDHNWFRVELPNEWLVNVSYDRMSYCDNKAIRYDNPQDSQSVEIAIFTPEGEWYIAEGMSVWEAPEYEDHPPVKQGTFGWKSAQELFEIIDYVALFDPPPS